MILAIDASNVGSGGGITHLKELLRNAKPKDYGFNKVVIWGSKNLLNQINEQDWLVKKHERWLDRSIFFRVLWQIFFRDDKVREQGTDLLFLPNASLSNFHPQVSICQNQLPFDKRELNLYWPSLVFLRLRLLRYQYFKAFKKADGLIFLSEYSLKKVKSQINELKVESTIINHGVNSIFNGKNKRDFSQKGRVEIIYVSTIDMYKHQWNVSQAVFNLVRKGYTNIHLSLVGSAYSRALHKLKAVRAQNKDLDEYVSYSGPMEYNKLPNHYERAQIGILASSCETFGMILLEKMASGLPIACSDRAASLEIAGNSVLYFDPYDVKSIEDKLTELIRSTALREELSKRAVERSQDFSWSKCSNQTFKYLQMIIKKNKEACAE
jgi:glycosyltransferase involved in cell wall biosynthesis